MRGNMTVLIVLAVCALVTLAYIFLGKMKLDQLVSEARQENETLVAQYDTISRHTQEIPKLAARQGEWLESLEMFRDAIPAEINDHVFFNNLSRELKQQNVRMLGMQLGAGGTWMGRIRDAQAEKLSGIGVDVAAAKQVKVAHYSITLTGSYDEVLRVFENLKRYRRLYTIDQITSPTGGAAGTITQVVNPEQTAMEVTGKIFYGVPADFIDTDDLIARIIRNLLGPKATSITRGIDSRGQELIKGGAVKGRTQMDRPAADLGVDGAAATSKTADPSPEAKPTETEIKTGWDFEPGIAPAMNAEQEQLAGAGSAG